MFMIRLFRRQKSLKFQTGVKWSLRSDIQKTIFATSEVVSEKSPAENLISESLMLDPGVLCLICGSWSVGSRISAKLPQIVRK